MKYPSGKLSTVTRKGNELCALLQNDPNVSRNILRTHYAGFVKATDALLEAYELLVQQSSTEERKDLLEWYNAKREEFKPMLDKANEFMRVDQQDEVASHVSGASARSSMSLLSQFSTTSSRRIKLAEKKAKAMADKEYADELSRLRQEELKINSQRQQEELKLNSQRQQEELKLSTQRTMVEANKTIAEANLLEAELNRLDGIHIDNTVSDIKIPSAPLTLVAPGEGLSSLSWNNTSRHPILTGPTLEREATSNEIQNNVDSDKCYLNLASNNVDLNVDRNICNRQPFNFVKGVSDVQLGVGSARSVVGEAGMNTNSNVPFGQVFNEPRFDSNNRPIPFSTGNPGDFVRRTQPEIPFGSIPTYGAQLASAPSARDVGREIAAAQAVRASLPRVQLSTFDGSDLTKFNMFILEFERIIESQSIDDVFKFQNLVQHTSGHPQSLVMSCNQSDASKAFKEAKKLLMDRYSDQYAISHAYIQRLKNWPTIKGDNAKGLEELSIYLTSCANVSRNMTALNQLNSIDEMMNIVSKLPYKLQNNFKYFAISIRDSKGPIEFVDLVNFVRHESRVLNQPMFSLLNQPTDRRLSNARHDKGRVLTTIVDKPVTEIAKYNRISCLFCRKDGHLIDRCFSFKRLSYNERSKFVKKSGICFGCLASSSHRSSCCPNRLTCSTCNGRHPTSLHRGETTGSGGPKSNSDTSRLSSVARSDSEQDAPRVRTMIADVSAPGVEKRKVLHAIIPVRVDVQGREPSYVYASLDGCSSDCWISSSFLSSLGIASNKTTISMTTMEKKSSSFITRMVSNLSVSDCQGYNKVIIPILYSKENWPFDRSDVPRYEDIRQYEHLHKVPYDFLDANIEILIGMNMPHLIKPINLIDGPVEGPYATYHRLGWAFNGPISSLDEHSSSCFRTKLESYNALECRIESYFSQEFSDSICDLDGDSIEDQKWRERVESSINLLPSNNYQIDLPFREDNVIFPFNRSQARTRFLSTQRRFLRDPLYFEDYRRFMESMLIANFAERIPECDLQVQPGKCWYLVHHSVYHKVKQKIRIVFDCSLKYQHISLNDQLLQGPDNTNNLLGVLLRFRKNNIAIMADVEKMFYQVKVTKKHTNFLRFLWFPDSNPAAQPVDYRLLVHVFGARSSPSIANYALRRTAGDFEPSEQTPASIGVREHFYVDDYLQSFEDETQAATTVHSIRTMLAKGGFNLTGFVSNSERFIRTIDQGLVADGVVCRDIFDENIPCSRALGVLWDIKHDELGFKMNIQEKPLTRRGLLSISFSLYDPLGLVGPAILQPKELFRETCRLKLGWDDPLPLAVANKWNAWLRDAPLLTNYRITRCYHPLGRITDMQLHIFSDGSETAYGAVAYMRCVMNDKIITCTPIMAKSRLTPLSVSMHPTVPRIELQAGKLAAKLFNVLNRELKINFNATYFWTDSSTVLRYINNDTRRFHRYVANRVAYIRSLSRPENWRYVPGECNPADVASRGLMPSQFVCCKLWADGPQFLSKPESEWPAPLPLSPLSEDDKEIKPEKLCVTTFATKIISNDDIFDRLLNSCSEWHRLKRRFAWLLRAKSKLMGISSMHDQLDLPEIQKAELQILKLVQAKYYAQVISDLRNDIMRNKHCLSKLNPYLDSDGIIRVGGRLRRSTDVSYELKHPIILPSGSNVSELIVRHYHVHVCGHLGRESVRSAVRSHYWIVSDSTLIRRVLKYCVICRKVKAQPGVQLMADLPHDRVEGDHPAFFSTGIDIFGPFHTIIGRKNSKRYGVVFTCMASRAIHLEIVASLTTDSFIMALRRFICRRGSVKIIRCDNGTNLVGAKNELRKELEKWNKSKISLGLEQYGIEWRFRPPTASHFGGVWEREIRTVRQILNSLLNEQPMRLSDEGLCTLMCEAEAILNNRPISRSSSDPDDEEALTPNHLLLCNYETSFPPGLFEKSDLYAAKRWRQVQYLADVFWSRWRRSYLILLQERQKWRTPRPSFAAGDLVLVVDYILPRNQWPVGKIEAPVLSADGLVRSVRVKLAKCKNIKNLPVVSIVERPISKVILLRSMDTL